MEARLQILPWYLAGTALLIKIFYISKQPYFWSFDQKGLAFVGDLFCLCYHLEIFLAFSTAGLGYKKKQTTENPGNSFPCPSSCPCQSVFSPFISLCLLYVVWGVFNCTQRGQWRKLSTHLFGGRSLSYILHLLINLHNDPLKWNYWHFHFTYESEWEKG